jgi:hypothetical protein
MIDNQQIFLENICIHSTIWARQLQLFQDIQQLKNNKKGFPYIEFTMKGLILVKMEVKGYFLIKKFPS